MVLNVGEKKEVDEKSSKSDIMLPSCPTTIRTSSVAPSSQEQLSAKKTTATRRCGMLSVMLGLLLLSLLVCIGVLGAMVASRHTCKHELQRCERRMEAITMEDFEDHAQDMEEDMEEDMDPWNRIADRVRECVEFHGRSRFRVDVTCLQTQLLTNCWREIKEIEFRKFRGSSKP